MRVTVAWCRELGEPLDQATSGCGCDQTIAGCDCAYACDELIARDVFEQEPTGAGLERSVEVLVEVKRGQDQDPRRKAAGDDSASGFDPVEVRHAHIQKRDVWPCVSGKVDGFDPVCGLAHHGDVGLVFQDGGEPGADERLVVGNQDADHAGSNALSVNPPLSPPASSSPPSSETRSAIPTKPWPPADERGW